MEKNNFGGNATDINSDPSEITQGGTIPQKKATGLTVGGNGKTSWADRLKRNASVIKSADQLTVMKGFVSKMKNGEDIPLIGIASPSVLFNQLDQDKTLTENDKKELLTCVLISNRRKLEQKRIRIEKLKLQKGIGKKYKNFDGGYQHKYSDAEITSARKAMDAALAEKTRLQARYDTACLKYTEAEKIYNDCYKRRPLCNVHKNNVKSSWTSWRDTRDTTQTLLNAAITAYVKAKALYDTMIAEDERFVKQQELDAREAEARQEELRAQEVHEAKLKAEGMNLQNIKMEVVKQATEIGKLETEEKKLNDSKTFGATIVNTVAPKADKKTILIMAAVSLAVIAAIIVYKRKKSIS